VLDWGELSSRVALHEVRTTTVQFFFECEPLGQPNLPRRTRTPSVSFKDEAFRHGVCVVAVLLLIALTGFGGDQQSDAASTTKPTAPATVPGGWSCATAPSPGSRISGECLPLYAGIRTTRRPGEAIPA
jgi:hypothetical protein